MTSYNDIIDAKVLLAVKLKDIACLFHLFPIPQVI